MSNTRKKKTTEEEIFRLHGMIESVYGGRHPRPRGCRWSKDECRPDDSQRMSLNSYVRKTREISTEPAQPSQFRRPSPVNGLSQDRKRQRGREKVRETRPREQKWRRKTSRMTQERPVRHRFLFQFRRLPSLLRRDVQRSEDAAVARFLRGSRKTGPPMNVYIERDGPSRESIEILLSQRKLGRKVVVYSPVHSGGHTGAEADETL